MSEPEHQFQNEDKSANVLLNDHHSRLNPTLTKAVIEVQNLNDLQSQIELASRKRHPISIGGAGFAMGGQQFGKNTLHFNTKRLNRVLQFDREVGLLEVEAGISWAELIPNYLKRQLGSELQWGIAQKQTGADLFTIGGAVSVNIHGGGLCMPPFIANIEAFRLVDSKGALRTCSRTTNIDLFQLVVGGYGLFGILYSVILRLVPRTKIQRVVEIVDANDLISIMTQRMNDGFLFGSFQFSIDPASQDFLKKGIFVSYLPIDPATPISAKQKMLSPNDWLELLHLAHIDKPQAFKIFAKHAFSMDQEICWSDTHQMSTYPNGYHQVIDQKIDSSTCGSEMITELFVPRPELVYFLDEVKEEFRIQNVNLIYGTIRLIETDIDSFLVWAKESWACIVFNVHVSHSEDGKAHAIKVCQMLIDLAIKRKGSYYLPYHRWATREQIENCYPQFPKFLKEKKKYDPDELFQSDWYRHHRHMFNDVL